MRVKRKSECLRAESEAPIRDLILVSKFKVLICRARI